jgi:hypothetical protein
MGPIEAIVETDSFSGVVVLGQFFATDVSDCSVGAYVLAASADSFGTEGVVTLISQAYSPGISPVLLRAPVASVNAASATMVVGSINVDYSKALSVSADYEPSVGKLVEVSGTQPVIGGEILIDSDFPVEM